MQNAMAQVPGPLAEFFKNFFGPFIRFFDGTTKSKDFFLNNPLEYKKNILKKWPKNDILDLKCQIMDGEP